MSSAHLLPKQVDGLPTDVDEVGLFRRFRTRHPPRKPAGRPAPAAAPPMSGRSSDGTRRGCSSNRGSAEWGWRRMRRGRLCWRCMWMRVTRRRRSPNFHAASARRADDLRAAKRDGSERPLPWVGRDISSARSSAWAEACGPPTRPLGKSWRGVTRASRTQKGPGHPVARRARRLAWWPSANVSLAPARPRHSGSALRTCAVPLRGVRSSRRLSFRGAAGRRIPRRPSVTSPPAQPPSTCAADPRLP
jgi:hypothetical protein